MGGLALQLPSLIQMLKTLPINSKPTLHVKLQMSPEEGISSSSCVQLIVPLPGAVNDGHANKRKHISNIIKN